MRSQCQKFALYDTLFRSCHRERSEAKSKDLRLHFATAGHLKCIRKNHNFRIDHDPLTVRESLLFANTRPRTCHPERSTAESRDLRLHFTTGGHLKDTRKNCYFLFAPYTPELIKTSTAQLDEHIGLLSPTRKSHVQLLLRSRLVRTRANVCRRSAFDQVILASRSLARPGTSATMLTC